MEAAVTTKVTEHQSMHAKKFPRGEAGLAGEFPKNVKAYVQYGDSVTVLVGLLVSYGAMSINRVQ